jgi:hypothetical protein
MREMRYLARVALPQCRLPYPVAPNPAAMVLIESSKADSCSS